ncbi:UNVERIFIED_CONTAM: hypothetical protein Sradi_4113600 [Sesamum radiatum]|uniref:CCHC-type domain-containing protein n=1 Tax=Sesamum radiatum TaxID=300843 RepID=A0AAW2P419_SESRA
MCLTNVVCGSALAPSSVWSGLLVGLPILRLVIDSDFDCLGSSLSLTKEDQSVFPIGLLHAEPLSRGFFVVGHLLSKKSFHLEAFHSTLKAAFNPDRDRMLERCPYAFDKNLLVLAPVEAEDDPNLMDLNWCKFHIHIHGLPLGKITQEIVVFIGNRLEKFKEVDLDRNGEVLGSSICIRVALDIAKPLKRALKLHTVLGDDHLIFFTYERLQNFCYLCGCLGHLLRQCELQFQEGFCDPGANLPYGKWLRATPSLNSHGRNQGFPARGNANAPLCTIFMTCSSLQSQVPTPTPSRGPSIFGEFGNAQLGNTTSALPPSYSVFITYSPTKSPILSFSS